MRLRGTSLLVKLTVLGCGLLASRSSLLAQDGVRRFRENGVEYVEASQTVRQPMAQNVVDRREETVYTEEYVTQIRETPRTYVTPVTEYHWEPRVHGLNIFRPRTVAYHMVPHTRWEAREHVVRTPVTYRQLRPETRVVETPRRELGFAQRQEVSRTALAPGPADDGTRVAARHHALPSGAPQSAPSATITAGPQVNQPTVIIPTPATIGGVLQMEGDHPRFGAIPANRY